MYLMLKIHWVEKSADNRLDLGRKIAKFEAKCALKRLLNIPKEGAEPLRRFYLVENRPEVLEKLRQKGYFFDGFWYEKPVSPERYYGEVEFPEKDCPVATEVAQKIVNLPSYYSEKELAAALRIIEKYVAKGAHD